MPPVSSGPRTTGSAHFDPDALFADWAAAAAVATAATRSSASSSSSASAIPSEAAPAIPPGTLPQAPVVLPRPTPPPPPPPPLLLLAQNTNDFRAAITATFNLARADTYVYHAVASVTLAQVQEAVEHAGQAGLHAWYRDPDGGGKGEGKGDVVADITAYTSIFLPGSAPAKLLTAFGANAKKSSIRARVAAHLLSHRTVPAWAAHIPRSKTHVNPALDFWIWSCRNLEWCGPEAGTENVKTSHHVLPVFMHHFGCVVPSYESLEIVKRAAGPERQVVDLGSGNGYWTYMLRRLGVTVHAVDNLQSTWRTVWIADTIVEDGEKWLRRQHGGGVGLVLLLVYPIVGAEFTSKVIQAYRGSTVVVVGTQNRSGYTGFKDGTVEEWMAQQDRAWVKTLQVPLPSFAGKDEAMFVFEESPAKS